jgi:hypothetical protein
MKKKYLTKKPNLSSSFEKKDGPTINNNKIFRFGSYSHETKHPMYAAINDNQMINKIIASDSKNFK